MECFIIYSIIFIMIFVLYRLYFVIREKYKPKVEILEIYYLDLKYNINLKKVNKKKLYTYVSIVNSLILTLSYAIFNMVNVLVLQIIITVVAVFVFIYSFYAILGSYLKNKR